MGFLAQFLIPLQSLIVLPLVVKSVGVEVYAGFILVHSALGFFMGIVPMGAGIRYRRLLPSARDPEQERRLFSRQAAITLFNLAVLAAAALAYWGGFAVIRVGEAQFSLGIALSVMLAIYLYSQTLSYFQFRGHFRIYNLALVALPALYVTMLSLFVALGGTITVDRLLILLGTAHVGVALVLGGLLLRRIGIEIPRLSLRDALDEMRFGLPLTAQFATNYLLTWSDRYVIGAFVATTAVAYYNPAYTLGSLILTVGSAIIPIVFVVRAQHIDAGQHALAQDHLAAMLRVVVTLAVPFLVGALFTSYAILALLGNRVIAENGWYITPIIALSSAVRILLFMSNQVAFVDLRTRQIMVGSIIAAATDLGINLTVFAVYPHIWVAAVAAVVSNMAALAYMRRVTHQSWTMWIGTRRLARIVLASAGMAAWLWALSLRPGPGPASLSLLAVAIPSAIFVYGGLLLGLGEIGRTDIARAWAAIRPHQA